MTSVQASAAIILALMLLLAGAWLRSGSSTLAKFYIPASLLAGGIGLLAGPEILGRLATAIAGPESSLAGGAIPAAILGLWSGLPELMINIVFAGLFLGARIPGVKQMWRIAGPQIAFGQTMAWGQYVVGLTLALLVLTPVFGLPPIAGALIEISFEGGHGTAAGLKEVFADFGFADGVDLALGLATFGVASAVVIGMVLVNWGARKGIVTPARKPEAKAENLRPALSGIDVTAEALDPGSALGQRMPSPEVIAPLTIAAGFIGASILLGWLILRLLMLVEDGWWAQFGDPDGALHPAIPFRHAWRAGYSGRARAHGLSRNSRPSQRPQAPGSCSRPSHNHGNRDFVPDGDRPSHLVIPSAGASPGTCWCLFCFFVLAPRYMSSWWFERAIADFGQSMGMTASGLLLLKISDPRGRSPALLGFGYTQLFFEPIVGGGLFTALAMPLIFTFGGVAVLVLTGLVTAFWMSLGIFYFGRR